MAEDDGSSNITYKTQGWGRLLFYEPVSVQHGNKHAWNPSSHGFMQTGWGKCANMLEGFCGSNDALIQLMLSALFLLQVDRYDKVSKLRKYFYYKFQNYAVFRYYLDYNLKSRFSLGPALFDYLGLQPLQFKWRRSSQFVITVNFSPESHLWMSSSTRFDYSGSGEDEKPLSKQADRQILH